MQLRLANGGAGGSGRPLRDVGFRAAVREAPLAQPRDHLALDCQMTQQIVELDRQRQKIVAGQGLLVAQLAERLFEALRAIAH